MAAKKGRALSNAATLAAKEVSTRQQTDAPEVGYVVPAVAKTIAIVKMLNDRSPDGVALPELSENLRITRSHCFSILRTMMAYAWVDYDPKTRLYQLSSGIAADTSAALISTAHLATIRPYVTSLSERTGFPSNLCEVIADGSFLVVCTANHLDPFVYSVPVGYRFPPGTPPHFKASLAWLPPEQRAAALDAWTPVRYSMASVTDRAAMDAELSRTRATGYAQSFGEFVEGFRTFAVPIFNREGNVFLVLSVFGRQEQIGQQETRAIDALLEAAGLIHLAIDGRPPVDFPRRNAAQ